ncbi:MAG: hypothetical protein ACTSX8_03180 [Alphaproteobacteria bacterium]
MNATQKLTALVSQQRQIRADVEEFATLPADVTKLCDLLIAVLELGCERARKIEARHAIEADRKAEMAKAELIDLAEHSAAVKANAASKRRPSKRAAKLVEIRNIASPSRKSHGRTIPGAVEDGQHADIVVGQSIRLFGVDTNRINGPVSYDRTFKVGDVASHNSYNLTYLGTITAIGAKTVTIDTGDGGRAKRLSTYEFNWRNKRLDLDKVAADNADTMMYI